MQKTLKGYILVFISVLAMANVYIFSKAALNETNIITFGVYWFSFALFYNILFLFLSKNYKTILNLDKNKIIYLLIIGILELLSTILFFSSIKTMQNPSIVSFLANMAPVFVTILSITFLKERFNKYEFTGILLTITGAFTISYNPGTDLPGNFLKGVILILSSNIIFAISTIVAKKNIKELSPQLDSSTRVVFLLTASLLFALITNNNLTISKTALLNISLGSLLGPFLAALTSYSALKYIEASKASLFGSTKSLFVVLTGFIYFGYLPNNIQFIGGIFTIIGLVLLSLGKTMLKRLKK